MIEAINLTKSFGKNKAVDDISFSVKKGQVLGFLGPNGAGKSTSMRMITGYLPPSYGIIKIGGKNILDNEILAKSKIGYLPENAPLYNEMSVYDFLEFSAEIRKFRGKEKRKKIDKAIELCFLQPVKNQLIDTLSKGYRHRTCLAQALIHDPEILILDEPTDGLDPNQKHEVRSLIKRMGAEKAIIFSTHILEEVEAVCSRAIIIDRGKIVAEGTPSEFKTKANAFSSLILQVNNVTPADFLENLKSLKEISFVETLKKSKIGIKLKIHPSNKNKKLELNKKLFDYTLEKKGEIQELRIEEGRLDSFFRSVTHSDADAEKEEEKKSS